MMLYRSGVLLRAAVLCCALHSSHGWIRMNGIFTDHMVLQKGIPTLPPARIFGLAYTNESVVISGSSGFPGPFTVTPTKTGENHWVTPLTAPWGNWSVDLTTPTSPGPYNLTIRSTTNTSDAIFLTDVVFGEVFFCNGQSNMELTVGGTDNKDDEYAAALALGDRVRINFVSGNLSLDGPQTSPNNGNWTPAGLSNGTIVKDFSAVCWGMGRRMAQWLDNEAGAAPYVGMVEVSVGGTTIHHWVPSDVGIACNRTGMLPSKGEAAHYPPGWIYNGRMNPMLLGGKGWTARSVLYYQGEADSGENDIFTRAAYECELRGLVSSYRRDFGQPNLPVVIVQLPGNGGGIGVQHDDDSHLAFDNSTGWSAIQVAQQTVARTTPGVDVVLLTDLGCCQLHYVHKSPVAERAANLTRELVYGDTTIDNRAPRVTSVTVNPSAPLTVDIHLNNTFGLHLKERYHCNSTYSRHGWIADVETVTTAEGPINLTCCSSTPMGHEGLGIVKFAVNATHHPRHYWGGWVPADLKIVSDSLVTATAVIPEGVNATQFSMVDVNIGGVGCVLANANGQPLSIVPPISVAGGMSLVHTATKKSAKMAALSSTKTVSPTPPPAPCACDVCEEENPLPPADGRIRIAAVGDSITRGHPLRGSNLQFNYPCTLQRLLGEDKYVVFNFGAGGNTMLKASPPALYANKSFWNSSQYTKAMAVQPHIVLIMLGTNDAVKTIWSAIGDNYPRDYADMVGEFKSLPSSPRVFSMSSPPLYNGNFAGINQTVVNRVLPGLVDSIAASAQLPAVVPVFEGMGGINLTHHDWFWGNGSYGCHPNMQGYQALSSIVFHNVSW